MPTQCQQRKADGGQCQRLIKKGKLCWQHKKSKSKSKQIGGLNPSEPYMGPPSYQQPMYPQQSYPQQSYPPQQMYQQCPPCPVCPRASKTEKGLQAVQGAIEVAPGVLASAADIAKVIASFKKPKA